MEISNQVSNQIKNDKDKLKKESIISCAIDGVGIFLLIEKNDLYAAQP